MNYDLVVLGNSWSAVLEVSNNLIKGRKILWCLGDAPEFLPALPILSRESEPEWTRVFSNFEILDPSETTVSASHFPRIYRNKAFTPLFPDVESVSNTEKRQEIDAQLWGAEPMWLGATAAQGASVPYRILVGQNYSFYFLYRELVSKLHRLAADSVKGRKKGNVDALEKNPAWGTLEIQEKLPQEMHYQMISESPSEKETDGWKWKLKFQEQEEEVDADLLIVCESSLERLKTRYPGLAPYKKSVLRMKKEEFAVLQVEFSHQLPESFEIPEVGLIAPMTKDAGEEKARHVWGGFFLDKNESTFEGKSETRPTVKSVWSVMLTAEEGTGAEEVAKRLRKLKQTLNRTVGKSDWFLMNAEPIEAASAEGFSRTIVKESVRFDSGALVETKALPTLGFSALRFHLDFINGIYAATLFDSFEKMGNAPDYAPATTVPSEKQPKESDLVSPA